MTAIILCGGLGTRLKPVLKNLPKCLAPVNGKPFLYHQLMWLSFKGFGRAILCTSYKSDLVKECFGEKFYDIYLDYSVTSKPIGTGLSVKRACKEFGLKNQSVLVLNGDTWFPIEYDTIIEQHLDLGLPLTAVYSKEVLAGVYIATTSFLKNIKKRHFEDNIPNTILACECEDEFIDIGTPEGYSRAQFVLGA